MCGQLWASRLQTSHHNMRIGRRGRAGAGAARTDPGGRTTAKTQGWARAWRNCGRRRTESGQTCKGGQLQLVVAGMLGWDDRRASRVLGPQAVRSEMQAWIGAAVLQAKAGHRSRNRTKMRRVRERGLEWRDGRRQSKKPTDKLLAPNRSCRSDRQLAEDGTQG